MKNTFRMILVWLLTAQARAVLRKYNPKVVAITGSVGKTSAKDAIYTVLAKYHRVRKSEKSFNSEVGLPLTILGVPNAWSNPLRWLQNLIDGVFILIFRVDYPEWLVLEVGADRPGDIRSLARWLKVDIAVITRLPEVPVHVEFFGSPEEVIEEKASLIDAIRPGGALLLFADDERTAALQHRLPAPDARVLTFGFGAEADVRGAEVVLVRGSGTTLASRWPVGMKVVISSEGASVPVEMMGAVGSHALLPALAGAAVGVALNKPLADIAGALEAYEPPAGRMRLVRGLKDTLIVDDTYNASPAAAEAALETLTLISPQGRRIAVLGDMMELGRYSVEEHRKVGACAAKHADLLITVGFRARDIAQGALDAGMGEGSIIQHEDSGKAGKELELLLKEGDCILIKGSQSMRMERAVEEVMQEPERAAELLVRQDAEWKKR
jgi:UDP-N-acetylmuramoyl-tripeptide--D-alanyl-D-alanine ligase